MFYKRRQWVAPSWWAAFNRKQDEYARRLARYLARKTSRCMLLFIMAGLELGIAWDLFITIKRLIWDK